MIQSTLDFVKRVNCACLVLFGGLILVGGAFTRQVIMNTRAHITLQQLMLLREVFELCSILSEIVIDLLHELVGFECRVSIRLELPFYLLVFWGLVAQL